MNGIDISNHNGHVDFDAMREQGVDFVYIKATEGVNFTDDSVDSHYNGAKAAGISHIGFYHYLSHNPGSDPARQAEDCWAVISQYDFDMAICLDVEEDKNQRNAGWSSQQITNRMIEWINRMNELSGGKKIVVYTGGYYARDVVGQEVKNICDGWIAHYNRNNALDCMETGFNVVGHQYSGDIDYLRGCNHPMDLNVFTDDILLDGSYQGSGNVSGGGAPVSSDVECSLLPSDNITLQLQHEINVQGFGPVDEDGIPGPDTLNHCPMVKEGARGNFTYWIQLRVGADADGKFGPATTQAVKFFQSDRGLSADGVVGRNTWAALLGL